MSPLTIRDVLLALLVVLLTFAIGAAIVIAVDVLLGV